MYKEKYDSSECKSMMHIGRKKCFLQRKLDGVVLQLEHRKFLVWGHHTLIAWNVIVMVAVPLELKWIFTAGLLELSR